MKVTFANILLLPVLASAATTVFTCTDTQYREQKGVCEAAKGNVTPDGVGCCFDKWAPEDGQVFGDYNTECDNFHGRVRDTGIACTKQ